VVGIGIDTTGSTPCAVDRAGTPLALTKGFAADPDAMFVLWKDHTAVAEAECINRVARTWGGTDFTKWASGWLVCYDRDVDGVCDDTATSDPNPIRQHGALDTQMKVTGPTAAVRFNADGTQGAAGASTQTFTVTGTWSGAKTYTGTVAATGTVALAKPS
jgi:hypothetical protein